MKTQIIPLELHDDVNSVRDKMGWSQSSRVLLVFPARRQRGHTLGRHLELVLLRRHAISLGAQLALVTQDAEIREIAQQLAIPVFDNTRQAQSAAWRVRRRRRPRLQRRAPQKTLKEIARLRPGAQRAPNKSGRIINWQDTTLARILSFGLSLIALFSLAAFLFPESQVILIPEVRVQQARLPVVASTTITSINLAGELPSQPLVIIVEGRRSIPTSGTVLAPASAAMGGIRFTNLTNQAVDIPSGTVVSTLSREPIRFTTTRPGRVRAGAGESVLVSSQALIPGTQGNVDAESLVVIEGPLSSSLMVTNPQNMHGGEDLNVPGPHSTDYEQLYGQLLAILQVTALEEAAMMLEPGDMVLTPTLRLVQEMEKTFTPQDGLPGEVLDLKLRAEFEVQRILSADLSGYVNTVMNASLPPLYQPLVQSLKITPLTTPVVSQEGFTRLTIEVSRELQAEISSAQAAGLVRGLPVARAIQALDGQLPLATAPIITNRPAWWPRLPFLPFRIEIFIYDRSVAGQPGLLVNQGCWSTRVTGQPGLLPTRVAANQGCCQPGI
jgi:hypothetical protein